MTQQIDRPFSPEEGGYSDFDPSKLLERFLPEMDELESLMVHSRLTQEEAISYIWELSMGLEYGSHQIIFEVSMALHHSIGGGGTARAEGVFVAAGAASPQLINGSHSPVRSGLSKIRNLWSRDRTPAAVAGGQDQQ
jgi:hypothetical protein